MHGGLCKSCDEIDTGLVLPIVGGVNCTEKCGDGKYLGYNECDDGNNLDGDGCSAFCLVEYGFNCSGVGTGV